MLLDGENHPQYFKNCRNLKVSEVRWVQKEKGKLALSKQRLRKFPIDIQTKVSESFSLISKKRKGHCKLIAAPVDVLPHGLGKFGHVLEIELQKKEAIAYYSLRLWMFLPYPPG